MGCTIRDLTGQIFGRLTAIRFHRRENNRTFWLCKCSCGKEISVWQGNLTKGKTQSCGCLKREVMIKRNTTHGLRHKNDRLYDIWCHMKARCHRKTDSAYKLYGGRGIIICHDWLSYPAFYAWANSHGYQDDLTIERIDVNGNYESTNCCWISIEDQAKNRRTTRFLTIDGETKYLTEWAEQVGRHLSTITRRIDEYGWDAKDAVFSPTTKRKGNRLYLNKA
jgi:hypothetical protein